MQRVVKGIEDEWTLYWSNALQKNGVDILINTAIRRNKGFPSRAGRSLVVDTLFDFQCLSEIFSAPLTTVVGMILCTHTLRPAFLFRTSQVAPTRLLLPV